MRRRALSPALGVLVLVVVLSSVALFGQVAVTTYHNDNYRSGVNSHETLLTRTNVNEVTFGKRFTLPVTGYIYGQPLYVPGVNVQGTVHNLVYVVTEHDQAYAFDVNSGQLLWHKDFLISSDPNKAILPISSDDTGCSVTGNEIGITSTPVIDLTSNEIYIVAETKEIYEGNVTFYQRMHVLDIRTGVEKMLTPAYGAPITARLPGNGSGSVNGYIYFDPKLNLQRSALTLANGMIYVSWAGPCDLGTYHGWVMAFNKTTLFPSGAFLVTPNANQGGIWNSGSGIAVDANGSLYVPTGNGLFDINVGGIDYGDTVLRLSWRSNQPVVQDYFTPWNQGWLAYQDYDVASGGVLLLPDQLGSPYPHLLIQTTKEGTIDLINRDNMGHFHPGGDSQIVQTLPAQLTQYWGSPVMWNDNLYFGGQYAPLKLFHYDPVRQQIQTPFTSATHETFQYPGPTVSVSSNGTQNGIVWIFGSDSVLRAYDANSLAIELYNSNQNPQRDQAGRALQFVVPTVADGMVLLGAANEVDIYGLLN